MTSNPTTTNPKIPLPSSLANLDLTSPDPKSNLKPTILSSQTLPQSTHKSLLQHLRSTTSITPLNSLLTTTLHKSNTTQPAGAADWPSRVYALALELLRSGACAPSFSELMNEVTRRALEPLEQEEEQKKGKGKKDDEGIRRVGTIVLPNGSYGEDGLPDVRIPRVVVERGVRFLEDRVQGMVEIVEGEGEGDGDGDGREEEDE